jgi:hypothetical protein
VAFSNTCLDSGYKSLRDVPSVTVDQCTTGSVDFQLHDPFTGQPIDLTNYDIHDSASSSSGLFTGVRVVLKQMPSDNTPWWITDAVVTGAATGMIKIEYTAQDVRRGGVFTAEAQIWQGGLMRRIFPFFFNVNPSESGSPSDSNYVLSVAEIRMTLRDVDPHQNRLLDELEYSQQEIMLAIRRCVQYWNETPPPVGTYRATDFPYSYHLSIGVASVLYSMAVHEKLRNDLPYSAGGVTVQDTVKWSQYREMQDRLWQEWASWVKAKKYQKNIEGAFMALGSGYAYDRYYR